jgi:hypothetical protein
MKRYVARAIAGAAIGSLFVVAMLLAYVADLLDREVSAPRSGTPDGSPESLQRISLMDHAT